MPSVITDPMAQSAQGAAQAQAIAAQQSQQNLMNSVLMHYLNLAANPGAVMSNAMATVPELSRGQIENIQNQTAANMAEHGFSQAPDMWAAKLAGNIGNAQMGLMNQGLQNYMTGQSLPLGVPHSNVQGYNQQKIQDPISSGLGAGIGMGLGAGVAGLLL